MPFEVKLCCERFVTIFTLEGFTWFLKYPGVFFFCLFFLSTLVISLMRLITLEIPFHKYYTLYQLLVDLCHLHIIPLQYMSWSVLRFYVLSVYPRSFNSDHTYNTYFFVVLDTGQSFLNEGNQCLSLSKLPKLN